MKKKLSAESVKVDSTTLAKVRRHVKKSKQLIGGFYDLAAEEKLHREKDPNLSKND